MIDDGILHTGRWVITGTFVQAETAWPVVGEVYIEQDNEQVQFNSKWIIAAKNLTGTQEFSRARPPQSDGHQHISGKDSIIGAMTGILVFRTTMIATMFQSICGEFMGNIAIVPSTENRYEVEGTLCTGHNKIAGWFVQLNRA